MRNKKYKLVVIVLVLIFFLIGLFVFTKIIINKDNQKKQAKIEEKIKTQQQYSEQVIKYLEDKYNRNFTVELYEDNYKTREYGLDGTLFRSGHDKNIKQYVFKATADIPVYSYITIWINQKTGEKTIKEINGTKNNSEDTSFEQYYQYYLEKINLKNTIDTYFESTNIKYSIDYFSTHRSIIIKIDQSFRDEIINNYKNVIFLKQLETRYIGFVLSYNDYKFNRFGSENAISYYELADEVLDFMENNFESLYTYNIDESCENNEFSIKIYLNVKEDYEKNKMKYDNLINKFSEFVEKYNCQKIHVEFKDVEGYIDLGYNRTDIRFYKLERVPGKMYGSLEDYINSEKYSDK